MIEKGKKCSVSPTEQNEGLNLKIRFHDFWSFKITPNHHGLLWAFKGISSYKIIYYKSGGGQTMIGTSLYRFTSNMFAFVLPNEMVRDAVTSETEEWICEFAADSDQENLRSGLYRDQNSSIWAQFRKIRSEYQKEDPYRKEFLDLYSSELFYSVLRDTSGLPSKATTLTEIINYIDEYYYDPLKIERLAQKTGYTCRHFRSLFTRIAGMPPSEYLLKCRLEGAKKLLLTTSMSVIEISQACGFSSSSQFAVQFRRSAGMSPSEFRNTARKHGNFSEEKLIFPNEMRLRDG